MNFTHTSQEFNVQLKSRLAPISLQNLSILSSDLNLDPVTIKSHLLKSIKCQDVVNLINEYIFTSYFDNISRTFYFSHPISYKFYNIECFKIKAFENILLFDISANHHYSNECICQFCTFYNLTSKLAIFHNQVINYKCKYALSKNYREKYHEHICGKCCLKINHGDELSRSLYVHTTHETDKFNECEITCLGGRFDGDSFYFIWDLNQKVAKKRKFPMVN